MAWNDQNIVAVTPFVLSYLDEPFKEFSWMKEDGTYYAYYSDVLKQTKTRGTPVQKNYWLVKEIVRFPHYSTKFTSGISLVKNLGQKIWERGEFFQYRLEGNTHYISAVFPNKVAPGETSLMFYTIK